MPISSVDKNSSVLSNIAQAQVDDKLAMNIIAEVDCELLETGKKIAIFGCASESDIESFDSTSVFSNFIGRALSKHFDQLSTAVQSSRHRCSWIAKQRTNNNNNTFHRTNVAAFD